MRRVLFLITDLELGGTPIVVRELATRLRSPELEIEVACLKPMGIVGEQLRERGVHVTSLEARSVFRIGRTVRSLVALVRDRQIDTVFSLLMHANFVASRAARSLPGVRFLQSIQTTQRNPRWHWWIQRRIHQEAERVVVPSESTAKRAIKWCDVSRAKIEVIPNAVDIDHFRGTAVPAVIAKHGRDARATNFRAGFVGRLDPVKRIEDLIFALPKLPPNVRLEIYGDGELRRVLPALAAGFKVRERATFHGAITDVRQAYASIDVLVLPSDAEGFGMVLIEAMAAGVPVIGTNVDGIRDVIRDGETGLLVPPRNPAAIAAAITRLAEDKPLRDRLAANALVDVQQCFAWPRVLEQYRTLVMAKLRV